MSTDAWLRFTVEADARDEDVLGSLLSDAVGGTGIEILDHRAAKLVPESAELAPGRVLLRVYTADPSFAFDLSRFPTARWLGPAPVSDDWQERWKDFFKPTRVTDRIVVRPPWEDAMDLRRRDDIEIVIEPGLAFGTGTHETTQLCLKALDGLVAEGDTVLDVGCGSGVLSIAAARLGADSVLAIDIASESVVATTENARVNGVTRLVSASQTPLVKVTGEFDLVVANILSSILIVLRDDLVARVGPAGTLLLSGVPSDEVDYVADAFSRVGLEVVEVTELRHWACLRLCPSA